MMRNADRASVRSIPTLSLFSGAGGLDIGFHRAGFNILAAVEMERSYCATLEANTGPSHYFDHELRVHCQDIREFDPTPYLGRGIECVIGGPPCQTFSAAGRRSGGVLGTLDLRGQLFKSYCDILRVLRPKVFVFENVYGLPGANGGGPWREIVAGFSEIGYTLRAEVLDSADYGVPQHRERLILVGFRGKGEFVFPQPTHGPDSLSGQQLVSVAEALKDLQDPSEPFHNSLGGMYGHLLQLVPEGLNYSFFTAEMGYPKPVFAWRSKFHDLLYKVDPASPCRTIKAQPGKFTGPFHWKNRHFTINELKRLQTFPDDYEIIGSFAKVLEQIGNSVPPNLAEVIAVSVREQVFERPPKLTYPIRVPGFQSTFRQRQRARNEHFKQVAAMVIADRFGVEANKQSHTTSTEKFYYEFNGFFGRAKTVDRPRLSPGSQVFSAFVKDLGSSATLTLRRLGGEVAKLKKVEIQLSGLSKYLGRLDSLFVQARIQEPVDLFFVWVAIEEILTTKSEFFTLIDIYGHYANRGDTVRITTRLDYPKRGNMDRALEFVGQSENCGSFLQRQQCASAIGVPLRELDSLIAQLRVLRWDIRTSMTHPTIDPGDVLCTYPFPLLSERAHLERRPLVREAVLSATSGSYGGR